jgi:hypothetical protein
VFRARPSGEVIAALGDELKREVAAEALIWVRSLPSSAKSAARTSKSNEFC